MEAPSLCGDTQNTVAEAARCIGQGGHAGIQVLHPPVRCPLRAFKRESSPSKTVEVCG